VAFSKAIPKYNFRRRRLVESGKHNKIGYIKKICICTKK
jgi:hypothetical protein